MIFLNPAVHLSDLHSKIMARSQYEVNWLRWKGIWGPLYSLLGEPGSGLMKKFHGVWIIKQEEIAKSWLH